MPITDFSQLPSRGAAKASPSDKITDFTQLPSRPVPPKDERIDLGLPSALTMDEQPSFTSEAGGMPILSKKGLREWKKYNTPGLPAPVDFENPPPGKELPTQGEKALTFGAEVADLVLSGAGVIPLAGAIAGNVVSRFQRGMQGLTGIGSGKNMTRREIGDEASETGGRIMAMLGSPVSNFFKDMGLIPADYNGPVGEAMAALMPDFRRLGQDVEYATGGRIQDNEVELFGQGAMALALGKGGKKLQEFEKNKKKMAEVADYLQQTNAMLAKRETERMLHEEQPKQLPFNPSAAEPMISFPDGSVGTRAEVERYIRGLPESQQVAARAKLLGFKTEPGTPQPQPFAAPGYIETPSGRIVKPGERAPIDRRLQQAADESNARKKAREQARANARAAFAQEPGLDAATKSERGLELNEADRVQRLAEGMAEQKRAALPPQAGDMRGGISPEAQSGMDKLARGKPLSLTDAERAALRLEALPSSKKGFAADPKLLTAAAVGATGLGLAMAYEPDPSEAALAIGAGALMLGKGKGLTLEAIRTAAEDTPLRAFRDASSTTLNTLENLPGNRSTFSKQSIAELLKRAEVTKAERDVLQPALDSVPGETITAKQLMEGVKTRTGDFELKPVASEQFADYGLASIGRLERNMMGQEDWIPEGATLAEEAAAQAAAKARFDAAPVPTTTIYRSPVELGTNNHFGDPNYFAHTRSFEEGGIKHVVELQSDLAQKAGKVLTAEERARLQADFDRLSARQQPLRSIVSDWESGKYSLSQMYDRLRAAGYDNRLAEQSLREIRHELRTTDVMLDELQAKLEAGGNAERVSPMLKNWHKRLVREELASAARSQADTANLIAKKQRTIDDLLARQKEQAKPAEWAAAQTRKLENVAYDLDVLAMDLRNKHVSEGTARQYMLQVERELPPEAQARWKDYYENNADETGGFLRPGRGEEGDWGAAYASNFPKVMADFLRQELGRTDTKWIDEHIAGYKEDIARLQKQNAVVRFATADTVAKVEGWPVLLDKKELHAADSPTIHEDFMKASLREHEKALRRQAGSDEEALAKIPRQMATAQADTTKAWERHGKVFRSPSHAGLFNFYADEVTPFTKQLGGKPHTDSAGHTWLEVPVEGTKRMPAGPRAQQFGFADPKLLGAIAAIGGGIFLGGQIEKWLRDDDKRGKAGSAIGAIVAGLGLLAASRHAGVGDAAKSLGRGAEYALGLVSTRVGQMSQPLLRRLTQHEFGVLKNGHERILAAAPFAEGFRAIKKSPERDALTAAILTNDPRKILPALGRLGSPALVEAWKKTREALQATGEELKTVGRLKNLREDYFPRLVIDHEGLLAALGTEPKTLLERALKKAEDEAKMKTGEGLSPLERSNIINKFLASPQFSGQGKAGFLKKRVVGEVTPELAKYYASPDEAILLYMRTATREIERAKFFKDLAVRDPETGKINIEASIGNVVNGELAAGRIKHDQVNELQGILRSRFGNGERTMAGPLQDARNLSNLGLLGNAFAALTQVGDVVTAAFANGFLPTIKAIGQVVGRDPQRITMRDMGLVNHISEEFTNTRATAHALEKAFKYSGFSLVDQFGKATLLNGTLNKFTAMAKTTAGMEKLRQRYGDYLGAEDLGKLASDLRAGRRTPLVDELLFRELSNFQPISKIEVPQGYLDHPNGRILYMLKTFALKQMDIFRREAIQKIKTPGQRLEGTANLLRFALALGISGASVDAIKNWIFGKDSGISAGDILLNFTKTYGMSQYALDQFAQGRPFQAIGSQILPPYKMWEQIVTADPKALRYTPLVGPALYWHATQDAEHMRELEAKRKARAAQ